MAQCTQPRLVLHRNSPLPPRRRVEAMLFIDAGAMSIGDVARALSVSRQTLYRWRRRWCAGDGEMLDRSCRPQRSPQRISGERERRIVALRRTTGYGPDRLAAFLDEPRSTCARVIARNGLHRPRAVRLAAERYEWAAPGDLLHVDTKKLARIVGGPGHRIHGDRSRERRAVGWEYVHVAVDDMSRVAYAEVLPTEQAAATATFLEHACAWFAGHGVRVQRVLTDNGWCYARSRRWRAVCSAAGVVHLRTRPYRPQTNGKVERLHQSMLRECLYGAAFTTSAERAQALAHWLAWYNQHRPHRALANQSPFTRLQAPHPRRQAG